MINIKKLFQKRLKSPYVTVFEEPFLQVVPYVATNATMDISIPPYAKSARLLGTGLAIISFSGGINLAGFTPDVTQLNGRFILFNPAFINPRFFVEGIKTISIINIAGFNNRLHLQFFK